MQQSRVMATGCGAYAARGQGFLVPQRHKGSHVGAQSALRQRAGRCRACRALMIPAQDAYVRWQDRLV
jgi:hypothetical protein